MLAKPRRMADSSLDGQSVATASRFDKKILTPRTSPARISTKAFWLERLYPPARPALARPDHAVEIGNLFATIDPAARRIAHLPVKKGADAASVDPPFLHVAAPTDEISIGA